MNNRYEDLDRRHVRSDGEIHRRSHPANHSRRRRRNRQRMMMRILPVIIILVVLLIAAIIFAASGALDDLSYSSKEEEMAGYFGEASDIEAIVVKDGKYTEERISLLDGNPYFNYDDVKENYVGRFFKDEKNNAILYTNATETLKTYIDTSAYGPTGTENILSMPALVVRGETLYMSLEYLSKFMTLSYNMAGGHDGTPFRIEVRTEAENIEKATITQDKAIRKECSKKANIVAKPGKGAQVRMLKPDEGETIEDGWKKVMTEDLITGYIEEKHLSDSFSETLNVNVIPELSIPQQSLGKPVVLGWSMIAGQSGNDVIKGQIDSAPGLNVVSPTWFYIENDEGDIASLASESVVKMAHSKGIQVWGMVDNFTNNEITTAYVLGDTDRRRHVIDQLIALANQYELDGLNIDFETLKEEAGEPFIQFIREISIECRKNNLILSVDNYVPTVSSKIYNRKEQGIFADYVIIMGYDEHYNGSLEAGSVASIGFVTDGIDKTLDEVPAERVVNALPFYTRMWKIEDKTEDELITAPEDKNGDPITYNITEVQTLPMQLAIDAIKDHSNATKTWDETTKQNYVEWANSNGKTIMWLEDSDSLAAKLKVMKDRNIAGVAVWALGYSEPFAWDTIGQFY